MTDAQRCRRNGWGAGTRLVGDEGYGPDVIEITAVGHTEILATRITEDGKPVPEHEHMWMLSHRRWRKVERMHS